MTMMPLVGRIAFTLIELAAFVFSQVYWYRLTHRWVMARSRDNRWRSLHAIGFFALLAGVAYALWLAQDSASHYHDSPFRWWLNAIMAIYTVGSFVSGAVLGGIDLAATTTAWLRRRKASVPVHTPVLAGDPARLQSDRGAALAPARFAVGPLQHSPTRRRFLVTAAGLVAVSPFAAAAYGLFNERLDFEITPVKLPMGPAGEPLRGRTIAQISDIHISPYLTARDLRRVVDMVNGLDADLIVITGDFVTFKGESQYDCVRELQRLRARTGMLGCLGNHEIYTKTEDSITRLCHERDIDILRFEGRRIALGGGYLNIAGVDFLRYGEEQRVQEIRPWMKEGEANLLLSHNPNAFHAIGDMPVQAMLAGHTHGGQMRVEFLDVDITPAALITPYIAGMYRRPGQTLYVNRGLGTIGLPIRIGAAPEITLYELT